MSDDIRYVSAWEDIDTGRHWLGLAWGSRPETSSGNRDVGGIRRLYIIRIIPKVRTS